MASIVTPGICARLKLAVGGGFEEGAIVCPERGNLPGFGLSAGATRCRLGVLGRRELLLTLTPHYRFSPKDLVAAAAPDSIVAAGGLPRRFQRQTIGSSGQPGSGETSAGLGRHASTRPTNCLPSGVASVGANIVCGGGATARRSRKQTDSPAIVTAQSLSGWSTARGPSSNPHDVVNPVSSIGLSANGPAIPAAGVVRIAYGVSPCLMSRLKWSTVPRPELPAEQMIPTGRTHTPDTATVSSPPRGDFGTHQFSGFR